MGKEIDYFKVLLVGVFLTYIIATFMTAIAVMTAIDADKKVNKLKVDLQNATEHYKSENQRAEMFADYYRIAYRLLSPEKKKCFEETKTKWGY
jgi:hypothetical protein